MDKTELKELYTLLKTPLDTLNGHELADQLVEIEAWGARVSYAHREASSELSGARMRYLLPKTKELTELDRTTSLAASTGPEQQEADHLGDLQDIIKRRISLGQTLLKNVMTELNSGLKL